MIPAEPDVDHVKIGFVTLHPGLEVAKPLITPELTVAAVIEDNGRFLMVEEHVDQQAVFNQPAGHVEPGETIIDAVVRETREETAWAVEPEALLGIYYWPHTTRGDGILRCAFCARATTHDAAQSLDTDIITTHWLTRVEIDRRREQLRSPLVLAALDAWAAGTRLPLTAINHL